MATQKLPIRIMSETLQKMISESGISYREIERRANAMGYDINLWKILAVSKTDTERIKLLSTLDEYIEPILDVLECSPKDFILRMAEEVKQKRYTKDNGAWIPKDIREFIEAPDARPYIELAYNNYRRDKLDEQRIKLEEQLHKKKK